jgi:hypothetical protein
VANQNSLRDSKDLSSAFCVRASDWNGFDGEERKRGEQMGLDTPVVHAVNDVRLMLQVL